MIAILGTGKMGEALLSGLLRAGRAPSAVVAAVRPQQAGEQRLAHLSRAPDRDHGRYRSGRSERRTKPRFCGRSASLRTR